MGVRLIHLVTGDDGESHVSESTVDELPITTASSVTFEETPAGGQFDWHTAPARQYVVTLSGTLEFETRGGERFTLSPGDVLLAEDTTGGGHRWRLVDDDPWRRVYVVL